MTAEEIADCFRNGEYCQCNIRAQIFHLPFPKEYWVYAKIVRLETFPCAVSVNGHAMKYDISINLCAEVSADPAHENYFSSLLVQYAGYNSIPELRYPVMRLSI